MDFAPIKFTPKQTRLFKNSARRFAHIEAHLRKLGIDPSRFKIEQIAKEGEAKEWR